MKDGLDEEKARLYQKALRFAAWSEILIARLPNSDPMSVRVDLAVASIVRNIYTANNGSAPDHVAHCFGLARVSVLDCAGFLDMLSKDKLFAEKELDEGRAHLRQLLSLLVGLMHSRPPDFPSFERDSRT